MGVFLFILLASTFVSARETLTIDTISASVKDCTAVEFTLLVKNQGTDRVSFFVELLNGAKAVEQTTDLMPLQPGASTFIPLEITIDKLEQEKTYEFVLHSDHTLQNTFKTVDLSDCLQGSTPFSMTQQKAVKEIGTKPAVHQYPITIPFSLVFALSLVFVVLILVIVYIIISYLEVP